MLAAGGARTAKLRELCYNPAVLLVGLACANAASPKIHHRRDHHA
jgi:hypothetical protein